MKDRYETTRQALRDAAAEFVAREAGPQSLITLTRADISPDFGRAKLYISVLPVEKETAALGLLNRSATELKEFVRTRVRLPRMPHIEFLVDEGEKSRQRLDELSSEG